MDGDQVFVSICIPAYKRPENLRRLLRSVVIQTFKDYEVVVSDDSPGDTVGSVISEFNELPIRYFKNETALGTPANWNHAISKARGAWIKIMHDDDWFADQDSLFQFVEAAKPDVPFVFSRYANVSESGVLQWPSFPRWWRKRIVKRPLTLLARNVIGPPSVTMVHRSITEFYDVSLKWRVDIDYYIRILSKVKNYRMVDRYLVNVGIGSTQVTNDCINIPEVELPEGLILLNKYGTRPLRHILVYDAWWRIIRNVGIRSTADLAEFTDGAQWPPAIFQMVVHQSRVSPWVLKKGLFSKILMMISYILNRRNF